MLSFEEIKKIADQIENGGFERIPPQEVAKLIDHTNLNAFTVKKDIEKLVEEAIKYGFYSVCVNPVNVKLVKEISGSSGLKVCSVS
ncbi:MAG: hypothetical protein ABIM44_06045, partial [candidate division WOR-3 bacterium]